MLMEFWITPVSQLGKSLMLRLIVKVIRIVKEFLKLLQLFLLQVTEKGSYGWQ